LHRGPTSFLSSIEMSFWGVELLPGKKYEQEPEANLHVTSACLGNASKNKGRNSVQVEIDGGVFTIANLKNDTKEQKQLDLYFEEGEKVVFYITGQDPVHLTGYYVPEDMGGFDGMDSEDELDEEELKNRLLASGEATPEDFEDSEDEEVTPPPPQKEAPKENPKGKKAKKENNAQANNAKATTPPAAKPNTPKGTPAKETPAKNTPKGGKNEQTSPAPAAAAAGGKRKAEATTPKAKKGKSTPTSPEATESSAPGTPSADKGLPRQMPNGLRVTDVNIGSGDVAKPGGFVRVKYVGRLENGHKFDSMEKNSGFRFRLGVGEVIKGWDMGVKGMRVGGKRTLAIPPALAYGPRGAPPDIPPNATLNFEVELIGVN